MSEQTIDKISYDQFQTEGKLVGARCQKCSALYLPPRPMCTACYGDDLAWGKLDHVAAVDGPLKFDNW